MLPFVTKLLLSKQLKFEKGKMSIFDQRVLIFPVELLVLITEECIRDPEFEKQIYNAMKDSVQQFCSDLNKRHSIKRREMADILINLSEMNGYGQLQLVKIDYDEKYAIFHMRGLPSELLKNKSVNLRGKDVVDKYWAGMIAGGASFIFDDKKIQAIETRCVVTGKESCEFVAGPPAFLKNYSKNISK